MSRSRLAATTLIALMALSVAAAPAAVANGRPLNADLAGISEVPGPGDPDGTGTARLRLNQGQERICYRLAVSAIAPATAAHIHRGAAGVAGPVVVPLAAPTNGVAEACVTVARDLVKEIRKHPAEFYVNVHNAEYPGGAVRGQLEKWAPGT